MSLRIADVTFHSPFLLAPLAGVSDSPFRRLAREQGAGGVYTEMVSADGLVRVDRDRQGVIRVFQGNLAVPVAESPVAEVVDVAAEPVANAVEIVEAAPAEVVADVVADSPDAAPVAPVRPLPTT